MESQEIQFIVDRLNEPPFSMQLSLVAFSCCGGRREGLPRGGIRDPVEDGRASLDEQRALRRGRRGVARA